MNIHELQEKFMKLKNCGPDDVNELLVFAKKNYIQNEISASEYRKLVCQLETQGAKLPEDNKNCFLI